MEGWLLLLFKYFHFYENKLGVVDSLDGVSGGIDVWGLKKIYAAF